MIGVLGGAFNPPHIGHLVLAQEAAAQLGLDEVLLMPTGRAPHREITDDPGGDLRLQMTRLATAGDGRLGADAFEVDEAERHAGLSYMYLTLEALHEREPEASLVLLLGADAAVGLGAWQRSERILELAELGVAGRDGVSAGSVESALGKLGVGGRARHFEMPSIGVSSTWLRERIGAGHSIRYMVPDPVIELIESRGLYR